MKFRILWLATKVHLFTVLYPTEVAPGLSPTVPDGSAPTRAPSERSAAA